MGFSGTKGPPVTELPAPTMAEPFPCLHPVPENVK